MEHKRITLLAGHYGSGKTNIAVNLAFALRRQTDRVTIADIDIVNPYYRTKDSAAELEAAGIRLICSPYANSNVDVPALPPELYSITDDKSRMAIIDIGGDDRGALALGRFTPAILEENNYEMLMVLNCYRPLTRNVDGLMEVMREIETAGGLRFTALVNNSNLGVETTAQHVLDSRAFADEIAHKTGLPVKFTAARADLCPQLEGQIPNLFPLTLQRKIT